MHVDIRKENKAWKEVAEIVGASGGLEKAS